MIPIIQTSIGISPTNGEFVRVAARKAAMSMAIHDEIFYEMAKREHYTY